MEPHRQQWYRQGLGPRIDALEAALKTLAGNASSEKNIRMIAESLRASSASYGFDDIFQAARSVEEAATPQLPQLTHALVTALRRQLAEQTPPHTVVLLVGERSDFMDALRRELATYGRETLLATSAAQAQQLLSGHEIVFIVLDFFLPDQDGRHLLEVFRSKPLTAAIPIVVIAPKVKGDVFGRRLIPDVDGYFGKPADPREVAEFISTRLRRAHEVTRDARRDPLTGLLNRAAFCESFDQVVKFSHSSQEPLALVLLEVDGFHVLEQEHGAAQSGGVLQCVASVLSVSFRATDLMARWSPSQFAVLFPGEDQFGGKRAIEKAMHTLRAHPPTTPAGEALPVTLSAGLTVLADPTTIEKGVEQAEHFLYLAKTSGGNRIITSETQVTRRKDKVLISAHDDIALVLKKILDVNGFECVLAERTGEEVLRALTQGRFRLIVLEESGAAGERFVPLRQIRENPRYHRIPIVVLTSTEANAANALDGGANDYVSKPFSPFVFISRVRHLLSRGTAAEGRQRSILLVDMDTAALIVAGTTLHKNAGLQVFLARTAQDALQRVASEKPDIILLGLHLPEFSGKDLLQRFIAATDPSKTSLVLTAPANELAAAEHLGKADIRGVIAKPFNLQTLVDELGDLLNTKLQMGKAKTLDENHLNREIQRLLSSPPALR